jgi:putative transposase
MPRANRHYIPGCVWHITHRCHKKEFLLKFARDRRRYLQWLFEAKKRYGLSVLNYIRSDPIPQASGRVAKPEASG